MKRAANDQNARTEADSDTPDQGGPEQPSTTVGEDKGPPSKKSKQHSQASTDPTKVDEGLDTTSISRSEGISASGGTQQRQGDDSRKPSADEVVAEDKAPAAIEDSQRMAPTEFPAQLMSILQRNVAPDALWFMEGGEAIGLNRDLIGDVLNVHFRGMKFNSLVRNLNRWGFRRISHNSLRDKDRGYHHLLFQRDNPHLIHRMRRDASANDVVRNLDAADSTVGEESGRQEETSVKESDRTQPVPAAASPSAQQQPQMLDRSRETQQPVNQGLNQGVLGNQQHLIQGMSAYQQLEWQRQQNALAAMQFGALQSFGWGGLGNWNIAHPNLPSSPASALALGLQQQQQQQRWQNHAVAQQPMALAGTLQSNPASMVPQATNAPASTAQQASQQLGEEEEDSNPSARADSN